MKQTITVAAIMLTASAITPKRTDDASLDISDQIFESIQKNMEKQHELLTDDLSNKIKKSGKDSSQGKTKMDDKATNRMDSTQLR